MSLRDTFIACTATLALAGAAGAAEIEIDGEGYAFTLRDTAFPASRLPLLADSRATVVEGPRPFTLDGLGWRARASAVFDGGQSRVTAVFQRVRDRAADTQSGGFAGVTLELREEVGAELTAADLRYERRITSADRFELRLQAGYRFVRVTQEQELLGQCAVCRDFIPVRFARLARENRLDGHGLRAGFAAQVRLARGLHVETETGLALLAASSDESGNLRGQASLQGLPTVALHLGPRIETTDVRGSLATWDLAARLRGQWKGFSAGVGWRFERWSRVPTVALGEDTGFDGFTFGLGWRFAL